MAYKTITIDDAILAEVEAWANKPSENRTLSNAIETLLRRQLEAMKKEETKA